MIPARKAFPMAQPRLASLDTLSILPAKPALASKASERARRPNPILRPLAAAVLAVLAGAAALGGGASGEDVTRVEYDALSPTALAVAERLNPAAPEPASRAESAPLPQIRLPWSVAAPRSSAVRPAAEAPATSRAAPGKPPADASPVDRGPLRIPLAAPTQREPVIVREADGRLSLAVREVPLNRVLMMLAQQQRLSIVCPDNITTSISVNLEDVTLEDALTAIVSPAGCAWTASRGIIFVTNVQSSSKLPAEVQGRDVRVFHLDYASATDIDLAIKGMLSPVGQSFTTVSKTNDSRKTQEMVVVQDLPDNLHTIGRYIDQVDRPPRQVLIEAHILDVKLAASSKCGVNFNWLLYALGKDVKIDIKGFADAKATQAFFFSFDGSHFDALLEALRTQTDAKTLASPKVLAVNGQEARIQVGRQLGYRVTTTTETSTMENVNFLDVGVILRVTPQIARDGQILMKVKPEVSDGEVIDDLPRSQTTEVETIVMLPDGRGMVIGGLIKDVHKEEQQKVPFLGDLWVIGRLFQRRTLEKERHEIIIVLLPRIAPMSLDCCDQHAIEVQRATTRVLHPTLDPVCRPWEPRLPDAAINPFRFNKLRSYTDRCVPSETGEPCVHEELLYGDRYYSSGYPGVEFATPPGAQGKAGSRPDGTAPHGSAAGRQPLPQSPLAEWGPEPAQPAPLGYPIDP